MLIIQIHRPHPSWQQLTKVLWCSSSPDDNEATEFDVLIISAIIFDRSSFSSCSRSNAFLVSLRTSTRFPKSRFRSLLLSNSGLTRISSNRSDLNCELKSSLRDLSRSLFFFLSVPPNDDLPVASSCWSSSSSLDLLGPELCWSMLVLQVAGSGALLRVLRRSAFL